jgi:uncharacterized membrane protein
MALYYLHERAWSGIGWGMKTTVVVNENSQGEST